MRATLFRYKNSSLNFLLQFLNEAVAKETQQKLVDTHMIIVTSELYVKLSSKSEGWGDSGKAFYDRGEKCEDTA